MKNILISTGGSGGHVKPALNLYEHLKNKFNVEVISDQRGERFIDSDYQYEIFSIPNMNTFLILKPFIIILYFFSIIKAFFWLKKLNTHILISTGGYMSVPFCIAAKFLKIKIYLFEPNMVLGRSNKLIIKYSEKILCYNSKIKNFPEKLKHKIFLIDTILPKKIYSRKKNLEKNFDNQIKILVLGGSQGAKFFDEFVVKLILNLNNKIQIKVIQQVYELNKLSEIEQVYKKNNIQFELFSYDTNVDKKMQLYDIALTRCGASTLAELAFLNIPFIGIPFPYAKDRHQFFNAKYYEEKNCCWLIEQSNITQWKVLNILENLLSNKADYNVKLNNLKNLTFKNTWNNVNKKLIYLLNEY